MTLENGILVRNDKVRCKRHTHSDLVGQFVSHGRWVNTSETDLCVQMEVSRRQISYFLKSKLQIKQKRKVRLNIVPLD